MSIKRYISKENYDDIINLPHHVSRKRPHMSMHDRAAQFAPFAALTGYGDAIDETGRYTSEKRQLSDSEKGIMDEKLRMLGMVIKDMPEITVTYFIPDLLKDGGSYETVTGRLKRIHEYRKVLILEDGLEIALDELMEVECELFQRYDDYPGE